MKNFGIIKNINNPLFKKEKISLQIDSNYKIFKQSVYELNKNFNKENFKFLESNEIKKYNMYFSELLTIFIEKMYHLKKNLPNSFEINDYFFIIANYQKIIEINYNANLKNEIFENGELMMRYNLFCLMIEISLMFLIILIILPNLKKINTKIMRMLQMIGRLTEKDISNIILNLEITSEILSENKDDNYLNFDSIGLCTGNCSLEMTNKKEKLLKKSLSSKLVKSKKKNKKKNSSFFYNIIPNQSMKTFRIFLLIFTMFVLSSGLFTACFTFVYQFNSSIVKPLIFTENIFSKTSELSSINMINFLEIYQNALSFSQIINKNQQNRQFSLELNNIIIDLRKLKSKYVESSDDYFENNYFDEYLKSDEILQQKLYYLNQNSICSFINENIFNKDNCDKLSDGVLKRGLIVVILKFLNDIKLKKYLVEKNEILKFLNSENFFENFEISLITQNSFKDFIKIYHDFNLTNINKIKIGILIIFGVSLAFFIIFYVYLSLKVFCKIIVDFMILRDSLSLIPYQKIKKEDAFASMLKNLWE